MTALSAEDLADLRRWAICAAIIVVAHGAIAAGMVNWRDEIQPAEPAAAIVIRICSGTCWAGCATDGHRTRTRAGDVGGLARQADRA
jgi:hypothetical protein